MDLTTTATPMALPTTTTARVALPIPAPRATSLPASKGQAFGNCGK
jgi:hypothetical protein